MRQWKAVTFIMFRVKRVPANPANRSHSDGFAQTFFTGFHHALPTENGQRHNVRTLSAQGTISLAIRKTIPAPQHWPQRFLSSTWAKGLADLFIVAALRGSSRRSLGPRAVSNSETLAVHRICPALTHLVAHFLARLFAPGLAKRPTNFAAHAPSRIQRLRLNRGAFYDLLNCRKCHKCRNIREAARTLATRNSLFRPFGQCWSAI